MRKAEVAEGLKRPKRRKTLKGRKGKIELPTFIE